VSFGFLIALDSLERAIVDGLDLKPSDRLPAAPVEGHWKGHPAILEARNWTGPRIELFRTVRLRGHELEIANAMAIPAAPLDAPILGVDLVAARAEGGVVVADLSPFDAPSLTQPALPDWAQGIFSSSPLIERVTPATASVALDRVADLAARFVTTIDAAVPAASLDARGRALERYRRGHLADERMHTMLVHIFGTERAAMLMRDVLFPQVEEADVHS
jgi:hypothetical protein